MNGANGHAANVSQVTIRDRRELPFFQVRLGAVQAIRNEVTGPRRLRTVGFYALLCQIANEQRHTGEHRRLQFSYELLTERAGIAKGSVKLMLDFLQAAGVVRYERLPDPERGATISILHLLVQDGAWTPITVAMADHLASKRDGGHLIRELGLIIVLLEFCVAQRDRLNGSSAEVSRSEIARQAGLSVDRVDQCNHRLEAAGVLTITRRRPANGSRNLTSHYTIHEASAPHDQSCETKLPGPQQETGRGATQEYQGRETKLTAPANETARAADGNSQGGNSALAGHETRPSNVRTGSPLEAPEIENTPPLAILKAGGGERSIDPRHQLCLAFLAAWAPILGDAPAQTYEAEHAKWQAAAARLVHRHSPERLNNAFAQMVDDEIVGSRALTLPTFEKVVDQLIMRRHARHQRTVGASTTTAFGWERAREHLERAIQRHGRDARVQALEELAGLDPLLVRFVERISWRTLCDQPIQFAERRYTEVWSEIVRHTDQKPKETAA